MLTALGFKRILNSVFSVWALTLHIPGMLEIWPWLMSCILSVRDACWIYTSAFDLLNWLIWSITSERCLILWSSRHYSLTHQNLPNCIAFFHNLLYNLKTGVWGADFGFCAVGNAQILSNKLEIRLLSSVEYWKHWDHLTWVKLEMPTWMWKTLSVPWTI